MKQETTLQIIINDLKSKMEVYKNAKMYESVATIETTLELAENLLSIEKQQIKQAHIHNRCINNQTYDCTIEAFYNAENYYNETFKNNL